MHFLTHIYMAPLLTDPYEFWIVPAFERNVSKLDDMPIISLNFVRLGLRDFLVILACRKNKVLGLSFLMLFSNVAHSGHKKFWIHKKKTGKCMKSFWRTSLWTFENNVLMLERAVWRCLDEMKAMILWRVVYQELSEIWTVSPQLC